MTATPMTGSKLHAVPEDLGVHRAGAGDVDSLVEVLCRAFDEDPVVNWFARDDAGRAGAFRRFFDVALRRMTLPHDEVYTTADADGAALWNPPGTWQLEPDDLEALLPDFAEVFGEEKLERSLHGMETMEARHPTEPHFYLFLLGVDPAHHNRGIGSALLQTVLRRCDEQGLPAYLEATSPRNVPLYERHGFVVTETIRLPDGGPPLWLMWRAPRQAPVADGGARP